MVNLLQPGYTGIDGIDWSQWAQNMGAAAGINGPNGIGGGVGAATGAGAPMAPYNATRLGFNLPTAQLALSGLSTLGSLWGAFQQNKLAKRSFAFQRDYANTNLRNQTQSYNTQMEDRIRSRAMVEGMSPDQASAYLDKNRLTLPASAQVRG